MTGALTIARKEIKSFFNSPIALVVILGFLIFTSVWFYFMNGFYAKGVADLRPYFTIMPFIFAFFIPALTMRSWAEERRLGTEELLLTFPISEFSLVMGKFMAAFFLVVVAILLTIPVPVFAGLLGSFDVGIIATQYFGIILEAASAVAVGIWISTLAKNQISAFISTVLVLVFLVFVDQIGSFLNVGSFFSAILSWISLAFHYDAFSRGVIDTRDLVYYLAVGIFFLWFASWGVNRRKWS